MRKRNIQVKVMLNTKEYTHLKKQLDITGLNKSKFFRKLIMNTNIQPKATKEIQEIYRLTATIANNTNQIAKIANATGFIDPKEIKGLQIMADKCWQLIKKII